MLHRDATPPPALVAQEAEEEEAEEAGGVSANGAAGTSSRFRPAPQPFSCSEARRWPGGPENTQDDTCCGPAAAASPKLIAFGRRVPRF
jgi:hypothetical protein